VLADLVRVSQFPESEVLSSLSGNLNPGHWSRERWSVRDNVDPAVGIASGSRLQGTCLVCRRGRMSAPQLGQFVLKSGDFSYPRSSILLPCSQIPFPTCFQSSLIASTDASQFGQAAPRGAHRSISGLFPSLALHLACLQSPRQFYSQPRTEQSSTSAASKLPLTVHTRRDCSGIARGVRSAPSPFADPRSLESAELVLQAAPCLPSWRACHSRMDRPAPHSALGRPLPNPSSAAASTIYVSPAAAGPAHHHQLRHSHALPQLSVGDAPLRRGPKRAARGEVGVAEESSALWSQGAAAKPDGAGRDGPSPGLGTSPDNRDSSTASPTGTEQPRKKQKRNKPTLSCFECVERKTKVSVHFRLFMQGDSSTS
jgi:hypothetical protein